MKEEKVTLPSLSSTFDIVRQFIAENIDIELKSNDRQPVLLFLLQGMQGSGKTFLADQIKSHFPASLVAVLSLDDFYLPRARLVQLHEEASLERWPERDLYAGRGLPGTHDLDLLASTLESLCARKDTFVPIFDKSLHSGKGDRMPPSQWPLIKASSLQAIVLEGWCLSFEPKSFANLSILQKHNSALSHCLAPFKPVKTIRLMYAGEDRDWRSVLEDWRWGQEVSRNQGMRDKTELKRFLERFVVFYESFEPQGTDLLIRIDSERRVIDHTSRMQ